MNCRCIAPTCGPTMPTLRRGSVIGRRRHLPALDLYRRLGAEPYVSRLEAVRDGNQGSDGKGGIVADAAPATGFRPDLTPREQDVLALVVTGLSYAQIARSLFVTQSTVGFHLSKLYAKFAVATSARTHCAGAADSRICSPRCAPPVTRGASAVSC